MATKRKEKRRMTKEELRAILPKRLNKLGEWMLNHDESENWVINDMRAVLK